MLFPMALTAFSLNISCPNYSGRVSPTLLVKEFSHGKKWKSGLKFLNIPKLPVLTKIIKCGQQIATVEILNMTVRNGTQQKMLVFENWKSAQVFQYVEGMQNYISKSQQIWPKQRKQECYKESRKPKQFFCSVTEKDQKYLISYSYGNCFMKNVCKMLSISLEIYWRFWLRFSDFLTGSALRVELFVIPLALTLHFPNGIFK
ncbi:unnamed protein product [Brugia pahangi]|uniref:Secreted protein n=1 Tax=Brugia pahangi TaxID=6280 RepID=A0A0N4TNE7_BRUPA|nr:unnamed protein product [Brugia pahangi]